MLLCHLTSDNVLSTDVRETGESSSICMMVLRLSNAYQSFERYDSLAFLHEQVGRLLFMVNLKFKLGGEVHCYKYHNVVALRFVCLNPGFCDVSQQE